jgi:hypothetical protein
MTRRLRTVLLVTTTLLAVGCRRYTAVKIEGKLAEIRPDGVVVEVTAKPGMRVAVGTYLREGTGELVPASGTVRVTLPRAVWKHYDGSGVQIVAEKKSLLGREGGHTDVPIGVSVKALPRIPEDEDPWFAVIGTGADSREALMVKVGDEPSLTGWLPLTGGPMELVVATPADAEVAIGDTTLDVDETGLTHVKIPSSEIFLGIETKTLGKTPRARLVARTTRDKETTEHPILVTLDDRRFLAPLRKRLVAVETGEKVPARFGKETETTLLVSYDAGVTVVGAEGLVGQARWIAIEHETKREGESCRYQTFTHTISYEDVELRVFEARTGKKVATGTFETPSTSCPVVSSSDERLVWRPKPEDVRAWVEKKQKAAWK